MVGWLRLFESYRVLLQVDCEVFAELVAHCLPGLAGRLVAAGVSPRSLALSWFPNLFTAARRDVTTRLWDALLLDGSPALFRVGLGLLTRLEHVIVAHTSVVSGGSLATDTPRVTGERGWAAAGPGARERGSSTESYSESEEDACGVDGRTDGAQSQPGMCARERDLLWHWYSAPGSRAGVCDEDDDLEARGSGLRAAIDVAVASMTSAEVVLEAAWRDPRFAGVDAPHVRVLRLRHWGRVSDQVAAVKVHWLARQKVLRAIAALCSRLKPEVTLVAAEATRASVAAAVAAVNAGVPAAPDDANIIAVATAAAEIACGMPVTLPERASSAASVVTSAEAACAPLASIASRARASAAALGDIDDVCAVVSARVATYLRAIGDVEELASRCKYKRWSVISEKVWESPRTLIACSCLMLTLSQVQTPDGPTLDAAAAAARRHMSTTPAASGAAPAVRRGSVAERRASAEPGDDGVDMLLFTSRRSVLRVVRCVTTFLRGGGGVVRSRGGSPDAPASLAQCMLSAAYALCAGAFACSATAETVSAGCTV